MQDIVPLVNRLVPGVLTQARPSVVCVCTTRPKYLVFDEDPTRPACVVEFGDELRLTRTDYILSTLGSKMPAGAVARSLCCTRWRDDVFVHIQQGLLGVPWFRLSDRLTTTAAWEAFLGRAVAVMHRMHDATRQVRAWTGTVDVAGQLDRQAAICRHNGTPLGADVFRRVREWNDTVGATVGPLRTVQQHGDFSLNNLLVFHDSIAIIDFEEFGATLVPLHDAFGLALSVTLSQHEQCPLSLADSLGVCVRRSLTEAAIEPKHLPGLLMHHLIWRINQCHDVERRLPLQNILCGWARDLAGRPEMFFPASGALA
jgi:hypothetical protein